MEHESHHHEGAHHSAGHSNVSHLPGLEGFFDTYLRLRAPFQLPPKAKEFIVKYGPWITLVLLIIAAVTIIPLLVLAMGLTIITLPFQAAAGTVRTTGVGYVHILIGVVTLVMEGIAIPGLLKRRLSGWRMVYYAALLSAVGSLLSLNIVGLIIGLLVSMYVLFQIREYYH